MSEEVLETNDGSNIIPIKLGIVNCYIIKAEGGNILIDTAYASKRKDLERKLNDIGISSKNLKLIVLTHQDFDHTGNAAYLREKYNTQIGMHKIDAEAVERGDMLWNRRMRNPFSRLILRILFFLFRLGKFQKFTPDIFLDEGDNLDTYGVKAKVIHLPGHSKGSIGLLTSQNELFCGDLFMNTGKKPSKSSLIDIKEQLEDSVEKLKNLNINIVYPGHGRPFKLENFWRDQQNRKK
ncbi:MAG: MBL fold metallo-hydrolase [Candidatus Hodarchaeales archaeon]